jgi:hypothetical protein
MKIITAKLCKDSFSGAVISVSVVDELGISRGIPFDPANTDYQAFLKYQAEGGKVYGADEEVPTPADEENT